MIMIKIFSLVALVVLLFTGCAKEGKLKQDGLNIGIKERYAQAQVLYKQKMAPIAHYLAEVCGPKPDSEYIDCINAKRKEINTLSIYPENQDGRRQRLEVEKQLLDKKIDRKQFRAKLEEIKAKSDAERLRRDIDAGIYSGQY
jgi:hypothetical protein